MEICTQPWMILTFLLLAVYSRLSVRGKLLLSTVNFKCPSPQAYFLNCTRKQKDFKCECVLTESTWTYVSAVNRFVLTLNGKPESRPQLLLIQRVYAEEKTSRKGPKLWVSEWCYWRIYLMKCDRLTDVTKNMFRMGWLRFACYWIVNRLRVNEGYLLFLWSKIDADYNYNVRIIIAFTIRIRGENIINTGLSCKQL